MNRASLLFILSFFALVNASAKNESNNFYNKVYIGQRDAGDYYGPYAPEVKFNGTYRKLKFLDDLFYEKNLNKSISSEFMDLSDLWFNDFPEQATCPNFYLNKNIDYIQYLFRLQAISYLFEGLKELNKANYAIGGKRGSCSLKWDDIFSKCSAKTTEMAKFIRRAQSRYLSDFSLSSLKKLKQQDLIKFQRKLRSKNEKMKSSYGELLKVRVNDDCPNCIKRKMSYVRSSLKNVCEADQQEIIKICSEKDKLYGISKIKKMIYLLNKSNASTVINGGGHGLSCLKRYSKLFKEDENIYSPLKLQTDIIFNQLKKSKSYIQGSLFLPGALKEFDDAGLGDFIFVTPTPTPTPKLVVIAPVATPKPTAIPIITAKPTPTPTVAPTPKPTPVPVKTSAFESAIKLQKEFKVTRVKVNMKQMRKDFSYSKEEITKLKKSVSDFQTRRALEDMKEADDIGAQEAPLIMYFLAYLLHQENHQALHNITSILGEEFYVINDIENKEDSVLIRLENSESTNYQWQILILPPK